jgi:ceramide glucosyltransferase
MNLWPYFVAFAVLAYLEKTWKLWRVLKFFARPVPPQVYPVRQVSILQPLLSGDPTLPACLEANLRLRTSYDYELLWLVDTDDLEGQRICQELAERYPKQPLRVVLIPPPEVRQNPKVIKLMAGSQLAQGDVICVLDDDTRLPDAGFERCLPFLDKPGVGLVFGLPYYLSFHTLWSQWIACFVNSHSLMTYIPYLQFSPPLTINGMFYCIRRQTLAEVGGFEGLEDTLADDFAISQRMRQHGWRLEQTPIVHGISTTVTSARHYFSLIQRWFIFPRESLMRHLKPKEQALIYGLAVLPMFLVWGFVAWSILWPSPWTLAGLALYLLYHSATFAWFNRAYFRRAAPWQASGWVVILQLILPLQILAALISPQRIVWRDHVLEVERGGGFRIVRRRNDPN